jgi:outer membrane receptor for ferrienterochelin and colicins
MNCKFKTGPGTILCLFFSCFLSVSFSFGQSLKSVRGVVLEESSKGKFSPLPGANVFWSGTTEGVSTDSTGAFAIPFSVDSSIGRLLVVRYPGYESDTLEVTSKDKLKIILASQEGKKLQEVTIEGRIPPSFLSMETIGTTIMTGKELMKAACCNLSESFETNPAVEVNYGDAVTGARQIQMLGLSGNYTQMTQENMPGVRGLMSNYGMGFTPGPWVESIQVTKGVGSVANGYESMAGQINVELKKPDWNPRTREKLFVNVYGNSMGRLEANINTTEKLSRKWFVTHLIHGNLLQNKVDHNHDNFLDLPTGQQINTLERWRFDDGKGVTAQFGIQYLRDQRNGGQYFHHGNPYSYIPYVISLDNQQWQTFGKIGYIFPRKKYQSIGLMTSFTGNQTNQNFGSTRYVGTQNTFYANLIYQSIIGSTNLKFRIGGSFRRDVYDEKLKRETDQSFARTELVPGAFGELTWSPTSRFTAVAGLRADHHSIFGEWLTPRLHLKYDLTEKSILRISAGQGRRIANILAENSGLMASTRTFRFPLGDGSPGSYSLPNLIWLRQRLKPEESWNYGLSWNHSFRFNNRNGTFTLDAYRTDFINQVVVDLDKSASEVSFYNLDGKSYSNALQVQLEYEIIKRLDVRMAYKWLDVKQTINGRLQERPFVAKDRFFINLAYKTRSKWIFDATLNWNGQKRIPSTQTDPETIRFADWSPAYFLLNGQVSKSLGKTLDLYVGGENLLGFRQERLIKNPENPYGAGFDASLVWGPVFGRMVYGGLRWTIR